MVEEIAIKDLWWQYEGNKEWTLKGIDLRIMQGEILGITGPSGAGKTTLCMAISGLIPREVPGRMKGSVIVREKNTCATPLSEIVRDVGVLFQDPETQFVSMSILDEVAFALENRGCPFEELQERIDWVLKVTNMTGYEEKHPLELSGGQKQRVALASIIALQDKILILDEPTSNLDPGGREEIFSTIHMLKDNIGATIIIVEHNMEELVKIVDRMILIDNGRCIQEGKPKEFFRNIDFLDEKGVWVPQVAILYQKKLLVNGFSKDDMPIVLEEAQEIIGNALKKDKLTFSISYPVETSAHLPQKNSPMFIISDLHYTYRDNTSALRGINLTIHEGEFVAFLGQNGSGKTTLAKHLIGLLKATDGEVIVDGIDIRTASVRELSTKVGYVFQNPDHQLFCETVEDEVAYGPRNLGLSEGEIKALVKEALEIVGLWHHRKGHPFSFGKAERQRIAVASVLCMKPKAIVVDEPTTGQDKRLSKAMMELLARLNKEGKIIIVITHNMSLVAEYVRRIIILHEGRILLDAPTREVFMEIEVLNRACIRPPQISQLAQRLNGLGFPHDVLTVEEIMVKNNYVERRGDK